jgi:WD repeat-containing protein 89
MFTLAYKDIYQFPGGQDAPYVLDIFPVSAGLVATTSDGTLSILDPLKLANGPAKRIKAHHGSLTAARPYDANQSIMATAGDDAHVALWDLRQDSPLPALQLQGVRSRTEEAYWAIYD